MPATDTPRPRRIRPGMYVIADAAGVAWTIEDRPICPEYGGGWGWSVTADDGAYFDPIDTLRDAVAAVHIAIRYNRIGA